MENEYHYDDVTPSISLMIMAERERSVHLQTYHERTVLYTVYCNSPAVTAHTEQKEKAREKRQFQDPGCGDECLLRNMAYIVHKSMHSFFPEERERERGSKACTMRRETFPFVIKFIFVR